MSRQIKIYHGIFKFTMANSKSPHQSQILHGTFKVAAANSNSPRQNQIY